MPHGDSDDAGDVDDVLQDRGDMSAGGGLSPTALLLLRSEQHVQFAWPAKKKTTADESGSTGVDAPPESSGIHECDYDFAVPGELEQQGDGPVVDDKRDGTSAAVDVNAGGGDRGEQEESAETASSEDDAESSTSGSVAHHSESFSLDTSSMTFPPTPPSFSGRSESMSALNREKVNGSGSHASSSRGSGLRIFSSEADELAMKAILSPPHLRASSSTGKLAEQKPSCVEASSLSTSASFTSGGGRNMFTATAAALEATSTNIFQQSAKLLFRGSSSASTSISAAVAANTTTKPSSGSIVEEDLAKLNNNILVSHPTLPPPPFANMFACDNCREDIGTLLSKGRHHCRNCGGSFCADCSSKVIIVPFQVYLMRGEQRVCDGCYHRIKDFQSQAQSTQVTWSGLQPPQDDDFTQNFELSAKEVPVTIFNCSLFMDFSPFYGHLFLTREHLCFKGYKGHKIKIPFAKIVSLIKPQFYYINALQVKTRRREKFFFAEFNGLRDLAFLRMDQLIRAYQEGKKQFVQVSPDDLVQQAMVRRKSYKLLVESSSSSGPKSTSFMSPPSKNDSFDNFLSGKSTVGYIDIDEESDEDNEDASSLGSRRGSHAHSPSNCSSVVDEDNEDKKSSASDEEVFEPLTPDLPLQKMTVLLDSELRADVKDVFDLLWNDGIGQDFLYGTMEKARDIDILVDKWKGITKENEEEVNKGFLFSKENDFTLHRIVQSQHPPKITFPGLPPYAMCNRVQRFRLDKSANGGERWDRFIISDILRMARIPFSDYFEIETRWVFSRDGKNYCHVQAGLNVNFLKSTWFKSQINSSTRTESKEVLESWAKQAMEHLKVHEQDQRVPRRSAAHEAGNITNETHGEEKKLRVENEDVVRESEEKHIAPVSPRVESRRRSMNQKAEFGSIPTGGIGLDQGIAQSMRQFLDAGSSPFVQWLIVLVLLYCLMLIRFQQNQIYQLTATTNVLLEKLLQQQQYSSSPVLPTAASSSIQEVCQQRILEGASEALQQFFVRIQAP